MRITNKTGLRRSTALVLSAAGLASVAAVAAAGGASAATPSTHDAHVTHVAHLAHVSHLTAQSTTSDVQTASVSADSAAMMPVSAASATTPSGAKALAQSMVPASQWASFNQIITHESGWNVHATNPSSGAYGLPQALPGSKMASAGPNWRNDAATQIRWGLSYMDSRYGSPNSAWVFWQNHHWY